MFRATRLVSVLAASALLVAACGSDEESTDATTATTTAATEAPAATDAPVATEPMTTEAVTTEPMSTEPMTTEAMTTDVPATEVPATEVPTTEAAALGSLVDVATAAGTFTTLLAAVEAAGLTEDLATNKYTILAPTDEAFAALGQPAIDALLADPAALTALLQNHLLPNEQEISSITIFRSIVTVAGDQLAVVEEGDVVTIGGATVVATDIAADNGFIHVIDTVLVPAPAA